MDYIPLINTKKLGQPQRKCSCWWAIGWAVFAVACSVALVCGLAMRGVL